MLWRCTRLLCINVDGVLVDWHQFFGWIGSAKACPTHWCQAHTRSHKGGEKTRVKTSCVVTERMGNLIQPNKLPITQPNWVHRANEIVLFIWLLTSQQCNVCTSPKSFRNQWIVLNGPQRSMRSPINIYSIQFNALGALFLCCIRPGAVFVWMNLIWSLCLSVYVCIRRDFFGAYATFHSLRFALKPVHTDRNEKKNKWALHKKNPKVVFGRCCCWCHIRSIRISHTEQFVCKFN